MAKLRLRQRALGGAMLVISALLILLCLPPGPLFYRHATGWTWRPPPYSNNVCPTYTCQLLETRNNNRSRRAWPPDDGGGHVHDQATAPSTIATIALTWKRVTCASGVSASHATKRC